MKESNDQEGATFRREQYFGGSDAHKGTFFYAMSLEGEQSNNMKTLEREYKIAGEETYWKEAHMRSIRMERCKEKTYLSDKVDKF